jgi:hypothetical protein
LDISFGEFIGTLAALATPLKIVVKLFGALVSVIALVLTAKYVGLLISSLGSALPAAIGATITSLKVLVSVYAPLVAMIAASIAVWGYVIRKLYDASEGFKYFTKSSKEAAVSQRIIESAVDRVNKKFGTHFEKTKEGYLAATAFLAKYGDAAVGTFDRVGDSAVLSSKKMGDSQLSLRDKIKQVSDLIKDTTVQMDEIRKAFKLGLIDTAAEARVKLDELADGLSIVGDSDVHIDPAAVAMIKLLDSVKSVSDTVKEIDDLGQAVFSGLGVNIDLAAKHAGKLRDSLMLEGLSGPLATLTTQLGILGGRIKESSDSTKLFLEAKGYIRSGLLEPTEAVTRALSELQGKMTEFDLAQAFISPAQETVKRMGDIKSQVRDLLELLPSLDGEMRDNVKKGMFLLVREYVKLKSSMGDTTAAARGVSGAINDLADSMEDQWRLSRALSGVDTEEVLMGINREGKKASKMFDELNSMFEETKARLEPSISITIDAAQALSTVSNISSEIDALRVSASEPIVITIKERYEEA